MSIPGFPLLGHPCRSEAAPAHMPNGDMTFSCEVSVRRSLSFSKLSPVRTALVFRYPFRADFFSRCMLFCNDKALWKRHGLYKQLKRTSKEQQLTSPLMSFFNSPRAPWQGALSRSDSLCPLRPSIICQVSRGQRHHDHRFLLHMPFLSCRRIGCRKGRLICSPLPP